MYRISELSYTCPLIFPLNTLQFSLQESQQNPNSSWVLIMERKSSRRPVPSVTLWKLEGNTSRDQTSTESGADRLDRLLVSPTPRPTRTRASSGPRTPWTCTSQTPRNISQVDPSPTCYVVLCYVYSLFRNEDGVCRIEEEEGQGWSHCVPPSNHLLIMSQLPESLHLNLMWFGLLNSLNFSYQWQ